MKLYHISELEQLSGIKAPTIRMWEKRYGLIEPRRTATNIRAYDDDQLRKLLNVVTLLSHGRKISNVAALTEAELMESVRNLENFAAAITKPALYTNKLIAAVMQLDETAFSETFERSIDHLGMYETMLQVIYPFLQKMGIMWVTEDAIPVQEHFASALIRRKLLAAIDRLTIEKTGPKRFLLLLPPGERHETGLLFSDLIIRSHQIGTVYLGADVPFENIPSVLALRQITHILLLFTTPVDTRPVPALRALMKLPSDTHLLIGGNAHITRHFATQENINILGSPQDLLKFL